MFMYNPIDEVYFMISYRQIGVNEVMILVDCNGQYRNLLRRGVTLLLLGSAFCAGDF